MKQTNCTIRAIPGFVSFRMPLDTGREAFALLTKREAIELGEELLEAGKQAVDLAENAQQLYFATDCQPAARRCLIERQLGLTFHASQPVKHETTCERVQT